MTFDDVQRRHADDREATRTTGCRYCGATPNVWCIGRSKYRGLPAVPHRPHKARMDDWRDAQEQAAAADAAITDGTGEANG